MGRARIILAAVLAAAALAVLAGPASASAPAANTKFCKAAAKIGNTSSSSSPDLAKLKTTASQFKTAAKSAPPKVKKAMLKVASLLGALGSKSATEIAKAYA